MKKVRRRFSREFKLEAVRQLTQGRRLADVARELGVEAQVMRRWVGQVAVDPVTNQLIEGDIQAQTHRVLANLDAVLRASGSSLHHVVKTTVYLAHFSDWAAMNEVYLLYFGDPLPARTAIEAGALPRNVLVEIE